MKKLICRLSVCAGLFLSAAGAFGASTYYVATNGNDGTTDGTNPETPYATVGAALAAATEPGDVVQIGEGTFDVTATLVLNRAVTLRGAGKDKTTLKGPAITAPKSTPPWRGVSLSHDDAVVEKVKITGFQPTNGNYEKGGAVTMTKGTVRECHITGNVSYIFGSGGIGVYMSGGQVVDCVIEDNKADVSTAGGNNVGGIGVWMTGGTVSGCLIRGNKAMPGNNNHAATQGGNPPAYGGGVYMTGGTLANCTVIDNFAKSQGGNVYVSGAKAKVENCVISGGSCERSDSAYGMDLAPASALQYVTHSIIGGAEADHAYPYGSAGLDEDYGLTQNSSFDDVGWRPSASTALACGITADRRMVKVGNPVTLKAILHNAAEAPSAVAWTLTAPDASEIRLSGDEAAFTPEQVGTYDIALSATVGGETVTAERNGWFVSAPASLAVTAGGDIHAALAQLTDGCTLNVSGTISVTSPVKVFHDITVVGEGRDATKVRNAKTGSGEWRVFDINSPGAVVRGLTISGGYLSAWYPAGAGARIGYLGGRITECTVCNGNAGGSTYGAAGGVLLLGADALVDHCIISNNSTKGDVCGGVLLRGGTLDNCLVVGNKGNKKDAASVNGAGVFVASTAAKVSHCTIAGNGYYAGSTSGVTGGGLYFSTQPAAGQIANTILAENTATAPTTYGGQDWAMSKSTDAYLEAAALAFVNCAFETCDAIGAGRVKFDATPFTDAANGDYTVKAGSASIDAGADDGSLAETDLAGSARVMGWKTDIGAYEAADKVIAFDIASSVTNSYEKQVVTLTLTGDISYIPEGTEIAWTVDGEPFGGSTLSIAPELDVGDHSVAVTVDGRFTVEKPGFIHLRYRPGVDFTATETASLAGAKLVSLSAFGVGGFEPEAGAVYKWFWTSDGSGEPDATGKDVANARFAVGTWDVLLKVENADGAGAVLEKVREEVVTVVPASVDFTLSATTGESRKTITLTASASGFEPDAGATYKWFWTNDGSGEPDATGNPLVHTFTAGTYDVTLRVENADGAGAVLSKAQAGAISIAPGADFYVDPTGDDDEGDGGYDAPYATLAKALSKAGDGQLIRVRAGSYTVGATTLGRGIRIVGDGPDTTTLTVTASNFAVNDAGSVLAGFKLTKSGENWCGYALSSGTISNCWFTGCAPKSSTVNTTLSASGGLVTDCRFTKNTSGNGTSGGVNYFGAAVSASGNATFRRCLFAENSLGAGSGACDEYGCAALNATPASGKTVTLEDCSIVGNAGGSSGGLVIGTGYSALAGSVILRNCVLGGNTTRFNYRELGNTATHSKDITWFLGKTGSITVENCVLGTAPDNLMTDATVSGTTVGPIGFVDEIAKDFTPVAGSAAFGRGAFDQDRGTDFACAVKVPAVDRAIGSLAVTLEALTFNAPAGEATYAWDLDGDGVYETTDRGASFDYAFETPGWHKVGLKVTIGGETAEQPAANLVYVAPTKIYLAKSGKGVFPYDTEENAAKTLAAAQTAALEGSEIDVRGVFTTGFGSIVLNDVTLTGHGWATSEIIVSVATYYGGVTVRDLSIKSPGGNNTKGFNIVRDSVTLSNCWIHGYQHTGGTTPGGSATAGTFVGCRFTDSRNNGGSGIYSFGGTAKVRNSVFTGNYFNANSQDHYGIVYLSGNVQFENNVVYGNYAVAVTAGKASKSAGIYVSSGAPTVRNCVVRGNKKDGTLETGTEANWCFAAGLTPTVEYCNTPDLPDAGPTIQTAIPKFVDPDNTTVANRDFRLQADSPCIDAGLYQVWQKTAVDAAGAARFQGYKPDIGAYEFAKDTPALGIAADKARYYGAQDVTLTASSTNEAAMAPGTTYLWTVDGVEQDETSGTLVKYLETGTYQVTATSRQCDYFTAAFELVVHEIPGVDFDSEETAGVGRKTVTFTPRGTGGLTIDDAATYAWYVNDETGAGEPVSTERTPTLEFNEPGVYGVLLKVSNADGAGVTYEKYRPEGVVVETPGIDIALSETTGEGRTLITLTATPTGFAPDEAARVEWRWTDLQSATPELTGNPVIGTFRPGTWSVQVVIANADGKGLAITNAIADAVTIAPGADFYVAPTGDNANPGTKKSPYKTLAAALDAAAPGHKIKISGLLKDSYQRTVSGVEIYGDGPAESGLWSDAQSCYLKLTDGAFIHDIRIGQSREQGGILRMADDSCVVSNCWVAGNWFTTGGSPAGDISAGLVTHTLFSGNHCNYGPVVSVGGTAKVRNCVFTGNYIDNGADTKQTFKGVVVLDSTAVFENNTVYGNTAALCSDNVARQVCAGVYVSSGTPTVRNNIIWNNRINGSLATGTVGNYYCKAGEPVLANNCTEEGVGENPVTGDPGFTALDMTKPAEQRDFSITTASPCCDKGAPAEWLAGATDYAGNPRVMGWGVDLGAYEAVSKILEFGIEPAASVVTGAQAVAVAVTGDTASVPAGAVVRWFVDGEEAEPQGLSVNLPLEEGHHDIAVDLGGFFRVERKDCVWVKTPEAVDFTTDEVQGDGRKTVTFTAIARGLEFDPAAEFAWYWNATGEGDPDATGNPVVHTFGPGTYDVFVRVTNADGKGGTLTTNKVAAVVVEPMTASIRLSSTIGETSKSVALTAVASGFTINSAATCTWTWTRAEDDATGTLTGNPAINVYTTGTYSFALRIANADGEGAVVEASLADALRIYAAQTLEIPSGQGTTPVYLDQLGKIPFKTINGRPITGQGELTVTSADSYRAVEDVADYGAVGDGRTDDTAAIMAAIEAAYASGKPLYFPKNGKGATYLTRKGLILRDRLTVTSDPGVTLANASAVLDGAGQTLHINLAASVAKGATSCTVVSAAGLVVGQEITLMNASADSYAETLADVERIEGNTVYFNTSRFTESGENEGAIGAYSATGMVLTDISLVKSVPGLTAVNCTVENLTLRPYGNAADPYVYTLSPLHQTKQGFRSNNTLRVRNVTIEGSKHDGISAQGSGDIWIENCVVRDVKHKGIHWGTTCDRITIRGNLCLRCGSPAAEKVSNNGGTGGMYFCYNNHRVLIEGNRMVDCYRGVFGFDERDASGGVDTDSIIANNIFENCTLSGVSPDGFYGTGRHLRIAGNQFIRFTGNATPILFTHDCGLSGSVISGNVFGDFQDGYAGENGAIMIANANGVVIRGNVIERNPSATGSTDVRIVNSRRIALSGNVVDGAIDDTDEGNANIVKTDNVEIKEVK